MTQWGLFHRKGKSPGNIPVTKANVGSNDFCSRTRIRTIKHTTIDSVQNSAEKFWDLEVTDTNSCNINSPSKTSQLATHFAAVFSENLKTGIQTSYSQNCVETLPRRICRSMLSDITSEFGEATRHVLLTRGVQRTSCSTQIIFYFRSSKALTGLVCLHIVGEFFAPILEERHVIPARQITSRIYTLQYWRDFLDRKFLRKRTARCGPITGPPRARDLKPHIFFWKHIKDDVHISSLHTALPNLPGGGGGGRETLRLQLHPPRSQKGLIYGKYRYDMRPATHCPWLNTCSLLGAYIIEIDYFKYTPYFIITITLSF